MKKKIITLLLTLCLATSLCACQKMEKNGEVLEETNNVQEEMTERKSEKPSTEESQESENVEDIAGNEVIDEMEEWLTEMENQGICLAIWNDKNGTKRLMQEGEEYDKVEGDRIFACAPSLISKLNFSSVNGTEIDRKSENRVEIFLGESDIDDKVVVKLTCEDGNEFTLNFLNKANKEKINLSNPTGYEWTKCLGYDEPQMVVYNDTTGLRMELEEGAIYQLCEGDEIALYMPDNYLFDYANVEQKFVERYFNIAIFRWDKIELEDEFEFEITIFHSETFETKTSHVTLLSLK